MHLNLSLSSPCHIYRARSCVRFFIGLCRHMRRAATTRHRFLPLLRRAGAPACYSYTPSLASLLLSVWIYQAFVVFIPWDVQSPYNAIHTQPTWSNMWLSYLQPGDVPACNMHGSLPLPTHSATYVSSQELGAPTSDIYHLPSDCL